MAIAFLSAQKNLGSWDDDEESKGCELRTGIASILQILAARFAGGVCCPAPFPIKAKKNKNDRGSGGPTCATKVASVRFETMTTSGREGTLDRASHLLRWHRIQLRYSSPEMFLLRHIST